MANNIQQHGLIIGPSDILNKLSQRAYLVKTWQDGASPVTSKNTYEAIKVMGAYAESVFDAAHGRRYVLFVYRDKSERVACFDHHCRPGQ